MWISILTHIAKVEDISEPELQIIIAWVKKCFTKINFEKKTIDFKVMK